ncbi:MAG: type VI secretion system baseplate subunit TssK [Alteromonadaceae bacterium]|nr:MAG: type VI secretion system baseplate subunit TssK [Alteromonadaceae bacterium]
MSLDSKVVWSEGMFLSPQHFQQQERYFERHVNGKCDALGAYAWGVSHFEIDQQLLKLGKLSVTSARGVFPDGTPFSIPDLDAPPPVIELPPNIHQQVVSLVIPVRRPGGTDVLDEDNTQGLARYYKSQLAVRDVSEEEGENLDVSIGKLRTRLLLASEDQSGYTGIGVLSIAETREDKNIVLDENFVPSCVDVKASKRLSGFLTELVGLVRYRAESIAGRLADTRRGGTAEISDYMMLQLLNRTEPHAAHLASIEGLHPIQMYGEVLQLVGEFSTFVAKTKRPPEFAPYLHGNLSDTFAGLMATLREYLSMVYEQSATALPMVEKKYGIRVSEISDRSLISSAVFVLAVRADLAEAVLRSRFPAQVKIGPVERIRELVNAAMSGIQLKVLPVAPRQIPYRSGYHYFELEKNGPFWDDLKNSGGFALHIAGDFPGLEMEFWAIRQ